MGSKSPAPRDGFTLIELIVTLAILVVVLGMAYQILENCLRTERWVEREALPEKIGTGIMAQIRKDLEGALYRRLGTDRVFEVVDFGSGEGARDELRLYTTQEPGPLEEEGLEPAPGDPVTPRTISAIHYYLKENRQGLYTLMRRENITGEQDPFEGAGGISREIYDKVKSLSILCFDPVDGVGTGIDSWVESWDSRQRLLEEAEAEAALADDGTLPETGVERVSDTGRTGARTAGKTAGGAGAGTGGGTAGGLGAEDGLDSAALPPAAIPTAVRVEIAIHAGDERGLYRQKDGSLEPPRIYSTVVQVLAAQRIPLSSEDELAMEDAGAGGESGIPDITGSRAGGGGGGGSSKSSLKSGR